MKLRVVFDSTTVISALCFPRGRLRWLIQHWQTGCIPLVSRVTAGEAARVLAYPKFGLSTDLRYELLADYLPFAEVVEIAEQCAVSCRDPRDQPFLDLAQSGNADVLVSGDLDLLALAGQTETGLTKARQTGFVIETPEAYRQRVSA